MSVTLNKVTCVSCNNQFETSFKGKNPKCKNCANFSDKSKVINVEPIKEHVKEPIKETVKVTDKKKINCVSCKTEFESSFQGKTPKCRSCK